MDLKNITTFNEFKEYKEIDILLEEALPRDYASNATNFSTSLLGRGVNTLFKFLNKGKNYAKLYLHNKRFRNELAMGVLRTWEKLEPKIKDCSEEQGGGDGQGQGNYQGDGQGDGQGQNSNAVWFHYKVNPNAKVKNKQNPNGPQVISPNAGLIFLVEKKILKKDGKDKTIYQPTYNIGRSGGSWIGVDNMTPITNLDIVKANKILSKVYDFISKNEVNEGIVQEVKNGIESLKGYNDCPVFKRNRELLLNKLERTPEDSPTNNLIDFLESIEVNESYHFYGDVLNERNDIPSLRHSKQTGSKVKKMTRTSGRFAPVEILGDATKLDWSVFEGEKPNQLCEYFSNHVCIEGEGGKIKRIEGKDLKKDATSNVNIDAIIAIQYSILSAIQHTDSTDSTKMFAQKGGGISGNNATTGLDRVWHRMVSKTLAEFKCFLNVENLNPYDLASKGENKDTRKNAEGIGKKIDDDLKGAEHKKLVYDAILNSKAKSAPFKDVQAVLVERKMDEDKYRFYYFTHIEKEDEDIVVNKIYRLNGKIETVTQITKAVDQNKKVYFPDGASNRDRTYKGLSERMYPALEKLIDATDDTGYNNNFNISHVYHIFDKTVAYDIGKMKVNI